MSAAVNTAAPLLQVDIRRKAFDGRAVLQDLRLQLAAGESVGLVGASGCGKSTLLRIVAGLDTDYDGTVRIDGQPRREIGGDVAFVFQEPRLFPWLTVTENVGFDLGRAGRHDARVEVLLAEVGLAGYGARLPKQLSGGQSQRVAIARALLGAPRLLLLDEPFSAVDAFTRIRLQELLERLARRHGAALLLVTHDVEEAVLLCDRVLVLDTEAGAPVRETGVPLARPRDREDAAVAVLRHQVLDALRTVHAL